MKAVTLITAVCLVHVLAGVAAAEVTVSVTLTGPIDEILPLLEHLREMGVGAAADPLKLEMHSVAAPEVDPGAAPATEPAAPPQPPEPPQPLFAAFTTEPAVARPGEKVWLSILLANGVGIVDTVSATIPGAAAQVELYDNGENGDPVAGDGQWSAAIVLDPQVQPGQVPIQIIAFNANGEPVKVKDAAGQPTDLTATVTLEVTK